MRLFRRNRTEAATKSTASAPVWPPQPEVVAPEPGVETAAPPSTDPPADSESPARAVQVVTGPPPLRTPEPAPSPVAEPAAAGASQPPAGSNPAAEAPAEPASAAAAMRTPEPQPT